MSIKLAIDLVVLTVLVAFTALTIYKNVKAYKDPTWCMYKPVAFIYSIAAALTGYINGPKMYLLFTLPTLLLFVTVTTVAGLFFSTIFLTVTQVAALTIVLVFRKLKLVNVVC